jgi:two-component system, cell cycle sensor histidine kinase and response regulator CckA
MEEYGVFKARRLPSGEEIAPDDWALAHTIQKGVTVTDELLEIDAYDGQKKIILNYTAPVINDSGEMLGAIVVNNDITHHKQADAERERLQKQLNQAQKLESVGRLAGGVAHDFNNMLGVILGHTELALLQTDENHDLYSDLKEIQKAAKRSADTTKQLLAFARKEIISPKKIDLNDTVESMLNMLRRLIGEDIDLVWQPAAYIWPVKMDPSQTDQILVNLCVNARDAIDGVGKLTIETGRKSFDEQYCKEHSGFVPGDFVLLAVSDNGSGMDKDTLANLFEPFFTTKEVGKGTGLGLATIYGIVKQNNGFINVYSEPGQGSTFKIYLPRLVVEKDVETAVPAKKAAVGGNETILLVEDEPTILRMTRRMLERKGYSVISAATPAEAVEKATNHSGTIDMLMTDVVMPEMNGRDLAGKITALYPDIKLLFMSGYTANVIAHHGVLDDGVAFIQKPFSMAEMTEKVREILDMTPDRRSGQ